MSNFDTKSRASLPIGIFDYGAGGLTVVQAIARLLPRESFFFFADEAKKNFPEEEAATRQHKTEDALRYAEFVCRHPVKMLVVGCNLMSAFALDALRARWDLPVIGLVQPAILSLSEQFDRPECLKVAVFTTEMAAHLKLFTKTLSGAFPGIQVFELGCSTLPGIIDRGLADTVAADEAVRAYTDQVPREISAALLTCTRFPILRTSFEKALPDVPVLDPAVQLAELVRDKLAAENLLAEQPSVTTLCTTGNSAALERTAKQLLGDRALSVQSVVLT